MIFRNALFAVFIFAGLHIQQAQAEWSAPVPLGPEVKATSDPSCTFLAAGEVVCAVRNTAMRLAVNRFSSGAWTGWKVLEGVITSNPSCILRGTREAVCAARSAEGKLAYTRFDGSQFTALRTYNRTLLSAPSCSRLSETIMICAYRGLGGGMQNTRLAGGSMISPALNPVAQIFSGPNCTSDETGRPVCAAISSTGSVVFTRFDGTKWEPFISSAVFVATTDPVCSAIGVPGKVFCFARDRYSIASFNNFVGGDWLASGWQPWKDHLGAVKSGVSCAYTDPGKLACAAVGMFDNSVYANVFDGTLWSGWRLLGTGSLATGTPSCAKYNSRGIPKFKKVLCVWIAPDNSLMSSFGP
jgi:hypothetical protein